MFSIFSISHGNSLKLQTIGGIIEHDSNVFGKRIILNQH